MKGLTLALTFVAVCSAQQTSQQEHENDFMSFDANNDKFVDAAEVRSQFPQISAEDLSAFFIASDKNEDGLISFEEYMKASLAHEDGSLDLNDFKVY
eukprot:CAMPEP_0170479202 /NCGR_PEP_ID=MMETSP0208-20121228/519_1 /TAXON_ID=197538 /ORGANISM="Strombidium inclinatum, Strain S3" /LENGTH=96 /DNA_ID=CAMNT_0010751555 /DNA_START=24 /DNA_END=314 /DNA_ORIENTATION=+